MDRHLSNRGTLAMKKHPARYWVLGAIFKTRGLLMIPPLAYAFVHFDARFENSVFAWTAGLLFFVCGLCLRVIAQRHLRYRLHARKRLATTGPFRIVRNPVYWANMGMFAGLVLMAELPWMVPILIVWALIVYSFAIRFEESRLMTRFGTEYADYMASTPRWIPRFERPASEPSKRGTQWLPAIAVESHCIFLIVFPIAKEIIEHRIGGWQF